MLGVLLAFAVASPIKVIAQASSAPAENQESLTVTYNIGECLRKAGSPKKIPPLEAQVLRVLRQDEEGSSDRRRYEQTIQPKIGEDTVTVTFSVVPDAYYIDGDLGNDSFNCVVAYGTAAIVLPGHPVQTSADLLYGVIADNLDHNYVAGLIEPGLKLAIRLSNSTVACNSTPSDDEMRNFPFERDGNAYMAELGGPNTETRLVMAFLDDGHKQALIVLPVRIKSGIGQSSTFFRFDATHEQLDKYASPRGATAFCLLPPTP